MRGIFSNLILVAVFLCLAGQVYGGTIYFLVAEPNRIVHSDSYVLPLTDPCDIAYARYLIGHYAEAETPIVVANIDCSPDCINPWSWHVTSFDYFASATPEILDGWPGYIEGHCDEVPSQIGFWAYTVVSELGPYPRHFSGDIDDDNDVDFMDFSRLGNEWQATGCQVPEWCGGADLDENGVVNLNDLKILAKDWLNPHKPQAAPWFDCWNRPYQCYGDADGSHQGLFYVTSSDLNIINQIKNNRLLYGWPCRYPSPGYNPCADFNRDFMINDNDINILQANMCKILPPCPACH